MSDELVEDLTLRNVLSAAEAGGELSRFVVPYEHFMSVGHHCTHSAGHHCASPNDNNGSNNDNGGIIVCMDVILPMGRPRLHD
jgi:hypothetical protein